MQLVIRERMGLAYSTGCRVALLPGRAVAIASVGTRAGNLDEAQSALEGEIGALGADPPTEHEISTAISRLLGGWGRRELSSINRAHALGLGYHLFGESRTPLAGFVGAVTTDDFGIIVDRMSVDQAVLVRLLPETGTR
jgi:hypothetical protein